MADAYSAALIQALQGERQRYAQQNPLISGGQALNGVNLYDADKGGWENAAVAALQGFGSGALQGLGNYMVDSQYNDLNNQMFQALSAEDPSSAMAGNPLLQEFAPLIKAQQMERQQSLADAQTQMGLQSAQELRKASILEDIKNPYREGAQERLVALGLTRSQPQGEPGVMSPVTDQASMGQPSEQVATSGAKPIEFYLKQAQGDPATARMLMERDLQSPSKSGEVAMGLRKELEGHATAINFNTIDSAFQGIVRAADADSNDPASGISLVYNFMKMKDPGSTVREGEYATAENAGGVPGYVHKLYNSLLGGNRLSPEMRQYYLESAAHDYDVAASKFNSRVKEFGQEAQRQGIAPERVTFGGTKPSSSDVITKYRNGVTPTPTTQLGAANVVGSGVTPPAAPSGVPAGAKETGRTHKGKPVYQTPNGLWVPD